jgi:hypothetical protein
MTVSIRWHRLETESALPDRYEVTLYEGADPNAEEGEPARDTGPQAFLVRTAAHLPVPVHFHPVDQFQYFAAGGAASGRHSISSTQVHYADAFTPYGFVAGPMGIAFATLRARSDRGAHYMPQERAFLTGSRADRGLGDDRRRNLTMNLLDADSSPDGWTDLVRYDDNLRISVRGLARGQQTKVPAIVGDGAYMLIVAGCVDQAGRPLSAGSFSFVRAGQQIDDMTGVETSSCLAVLQYPTRRLD